MRLTQREQDRLLIFTTAELARRYRDKGLKLNYPEAVALICDEMLGGARAGQSLPDVRALGYQVLGADDVMPGVPELVTKIEVEALFPDGTKLITLYDPIKERG
jgi:urease subunit gamma/beta